MRRALEREFHVIFWRGAVALAFALVTFAWPLFTVGSVALLFGGYALVDGLLALLLTARDLRRTPVFGPLVFEATIGLLAGALAIAARPLGGIAIVVAMWAIATGAIELHVGLTLKRGGADEHAFVLGGVASIVLGAVVARGTAGAHAISWLLACYAVI
ncbi:MAG: DUF308 domain-containing protein, partial [Polyangiales bacterium]